MFYLVRTLRLVKDLLLDVKLGVQAWMYKIHHSRNVLVCIYYFWSSDINEYVYELKDHQLNKNVEA